MSRQSLMIIARSGLQPQPAFFARLDELDDVRVVRRGWALKSNQPEPARLAARAMDAQKASAAMRMLANPNRTSCWTSAIRMAPIARPGQPNGTRLSGLSP